MTLPNKDKQHSQVSPLESNTATGDKVVDTTSNNKGDTQSSPLKGLDKPIAKLELRRNSKQEARDAGDLRGQRARGLTEKLITRTTSGAIYAIVILACLFIGPLATAAIVMAMAWLCCSEFFHLTRLSGRMPNEILGLGAALLYPICALAPLNGAMRFVSFLLVVGCGIWYVITPRATIADVALTAFGPIYTSLLFSSLVVIRNIDAGWQGGFLAFAVMGSVWVNDAVAYFVGSRFGKHKLAPQISPHKTQEGFWAGIVGCVVIWIILWKTHIWPFELWFVILCGICVGFASVIGDLFESRIKRGVGVKDSGNLMPGHGGLLDRSDSMLFGVMVAYMLFRIGGFL